MKRLRHHPAVAAALVERRRRRFRPHVVQGGDGSLTWSWGFGGVTSWDVLSSLHGVTYVLEYADLPVTQCEAAPADPYAWSIVVGKAGGVEVTRRSVPVRLVTLFSGV